MKRYKVTCSDVTYGEDEKREGKMERVGTIALPPRMTSLQVHNYITLCYKLVDCRVFLMQACFV